MKMSKKFHQDQSESDSQVAKNRGKSNFYPFLIVLIRFRDYLIIFHNFPIFNYFV